MPQLAADPIPLSLSIKTTSTQKYYVSSPVKINAQNSLYDILKQLKKTVSEINRRLGTWHSSINTQYLYVCLISGSTDDMHKQQHEA
jgi:hypothetical protein